MTRLASLVLALACTSASAAEPGPYVIGERDAELLEHVLRTSAGIERNNRMATGIAVTGTGAAVTLGGLGALMSDKSDEGQILGWVITGGGALVLGAGLLTTAITGDIEDVHASFAAADLSTEAARAKAVLEHEGRLALHVRSYERLRAISGWTTVAFGAVIAGVSLGRMFRGEPFDGGHGLMLGGGIGLVGVGVWTALSGRNAIEETWQLYRDLRTIPWEPGAPPELKPVVTPVLAPIDGGLLVGLDGRF